MEGTLETKIDWKRKLTSRKFWAAVIGFVTPLLTSFGMAENEVAQTAAIIMAGATLIAYIIGEGLTDAAGAKNTGILEVTDVTDTIKSEE